MYQSTCMEVKSRRDEHSAATRTALIRVARRLFAEHGYAATTTEEVVRRARVTRGALYYHFRDKRALFLAVLDEEQKRLAAVAAQAAGAEADAWRAMVAGSNAFLDACLDRAVQRIVLIDGPAVLGSEKWREADQSYYLAATQAAIQAAIDQGRIEPQPVEVLAHIILGAFNEAAILIARADDPIAARRQVRDVVERLFEGLRGKPPPARTR
jgi:AcrR family transcriptional regulator